MLDRDKSKGLAFVGVALAIFGAWQVNRLAGYGRHQQKSLAPIVMGTTSRLIAVGPAAELDKALDAALAELQAVEQAMSTYDAESELSRFNRTPAGVDVPLSAATLAVMQQALALSVETEGAFDITMLSFGKLWEESARLGRLPSDEELAVASDRVGFNKLVLSPKHARKLTDGLELSLDGIAKGYAIDRALDAMRRFGLGGGLVDVGGDIACFGAPLDGAAWTIAVKSPVSEGQVLSLSLPQSADRIAVCTSGDYRRFVEIGGRRFSHIVDPRTGFPVADSPSVTVVAGDAATADAWATALSVTGAQAGFALLEEKSNVEALFVVGTRKALDFQVTSGFWQFVGDDKTGEFKGRINR